MTKGFTQVEGLDYFETFAPTVGSETLRMHCLDVLFRCKHSTGEDQTRDAITELFS